MDAVEKARPKKVIVPAAPPSSYGEPYFGVARARWAREEVEPHRVTQVAGGAIAFKASAPNFLSKTARWWLFGVLAGAGVAALGVAAAIVFRAQESDNAPIWLWPSVFSLVLSGMLFTLAYLTVMGFGKVDVETVFGAAAPDDGDEEAEAPKLTDQKPENEATDVAADTAVKATFSTAMDSESVKEAFALAEGEAAVDADVEYSEDDKTATLTPKSELTAGSSYTATVSKTAKSADGKEMAEDATWTFTVKAAAQGPEPDAEQPPANVEPGAAAAGAARPVVEGKPVSSGLDEPRRDAEGR